MRNFGTIFIAAWLVGCVAAQAHEPSLGADTYATIATRNIFGLEPERPSPPAPTEVALPPKILPDGITTILGRPEVLYKVIKPQNSPGPRTGESSYILAEGEQQDDVKVLRIDTASGVVIFNNHGTVQEITLTDFSAKANGIIPSDIMPSGMPGRILFHAPNRTGAH